MTINPGFNNYYIATSIGNDDREIAKAFDLNIVQYRNILKKFNGQSRKSCKGEYFFDNLSDAKSALEALEPYLILKNLTGG